MENLKSGVVHDQASPDQSSSKNTMVSIQNVGVQNTFEEEDENNLMGEEAQTLAPSQNSEENIAENKQQEENENMEVDSEIAVQDKKKERRKLTVDDILRGKVF